MHFLTPSSVLYLLEADVGRASAEPVLGLDFPRKPSSVRIAFPDIAHDLAILDPVLRTSRNCRAIFSR